MRQLRGPLAIWLSLLFSLTTLAVPPAKDNVYDKFRGRKYSNKGLLNEQDETRLAAQFHEELQGENRFVTDRRVVDYLNRLGRQVAAESRRPDLDYQFFIIDNDQVNAFTPGGGRVYFNSGLIRRLNSEGELAAVIGHEIGHIVGRHVLKNIKSATKWNALILSGAAVGGQGGAMLTSLFANGFFLKHSRDAEREADYLGLYNLRDAGYDIEEMNNTFRVLEAVQQREPSALNKIFSSHPPPAERLRNTQVEIDQHLARAAGLGPRHSAEFEAIKALLGGPVTGRPPSEMDDPAARRRHEDSLGVPRQRQPYDPSGARPDEAEEKLPYITEARALLRRHRYQGAKVVGTARGDAFGDGGAALLVVFKDGDRYHAIVTRDRDDYWLATRPGARDLDLENFVSAEIGVVPRSRRPAVLLSTGTRQLRWIWNGREFDHFNTR